MAPGRCTRSWPGCWWRLRLCRRPGAWYSTWDRVPAWPGGPRWPRERARWWRSTFPRACCGEAAGDTRSRPTRSRCRSVTAVSTWWWRRSASTTWAASPLAWPRPGGSAPPSPPACSRRAGPTRPRMRWMMPSARSATARRPGTPTSSPGRGPATRRSLPGAPWRRGSPAWRPARWPSRPGSPPRPSWCRGGWAWLTSPHSCARWTHRAGLRCAARPNRLWRPRPWSSPWWCSPPA